MTRPELQSQLDEVGWYHSVDVAHGVATKGMFDNRHSLAVMPFPDLRGKRCLDIGTCDGLFAFHMEQQGAAEVVAVDVPDFSQIDYPPEVRHHPTFDHSRKDLVSRRGGFHMLHDLLESKVEWRGASVYDLNPEDFGSFDVVVMGSLLLHLRDPVRALDAVRQVVRGELVVSEHVHTPLTLLSRRRPLFELRGEGADFQWWIGNDPGVRHLLRIGGFDIQEVSRYFVLRFGSRVGKEDLPPSSLRERARDMANAVLTHDRHRGHLHRAYRCSPRF